MALSLSFHKNTTFHIDNENVDNIQYQEVFDPRYHFKGTVQRKLTGVVASSHKVKSPVPSSKLQLYRYVARG
jgi:hypothetical protein